jgi:hypothetical protein
MPFHFEGMTEDEVNLVAQLSVALDQLRVAMLNLHKLERPMKQVRRRMTGAIGKLEFGFHFARVSLTPRVLYPIL